MTLADLEAFVAVAEAGSVNRAALRLGLTQPATTRRLQNFEAAMGGAVLLDRSSKPAVLTPAGRQALDHCRRVLAALGALRSSLAETAQPAGDLRIGIAHGLAEMVTSAPLDDLRRRFPALRLSVRCDWTKPLIDEVRHGGLDCAVALVSEHQPLAPEIAAETIGAERVVVVAPKALRLAGRKRRLRIADLEGQGWIVNTAGCGYREALQRAFDRAESVLRIAGEILDYDLQMSLIARGAGIGLVPLRKYERSPLRRRLRLLPLEDFALTARTMMLRNPALGGLRPAVDRLRATIGERLYGHRKSS